MAMTLCSVRKAVNAGMSSSASADEDVCPLFPFVETNDLFLKAVISGIACGPGCCADWSSLFLRRISGVL